MRYDTPAGSASSRILHRAWMAVPGDKAERVPIGDLENVVGEVCHWEEFVPVGFEMSVRIEEGDGAFGSAGQWNDVEEFWELDLVERGVG